MIPKIIHAFWDGPEPPEYIRDIWAKWRDLHPDWIFNLWDDATRPTLRHEELYRDVDRFSPKSHVWQFRTDLLRYELLYDYGGVWVDSDLEPLRPIDDLLDCEAFCARESDRYVNCGFIASVRRGAFVHDVLSKLRPRILSMPTARSNKQIGPHLITDRVKHHPEVRVLPRELVYPYSWDSLNWDGQHDADAYTVHHWHHKRTSEGKQL